MDLNLPGIVFYDQYALWPSRQYQGQVELCADGFYMIAPGDGSPTISSKLEIGESLEIDNTYPFYAVWNEQGWSYQTWPVMKQ